MEERISSWPWCVHGVGLSWMKVGKGGLLATRRCFRMRSWISAGIVRGGWHCLRKKNYFFFLGSGTKRDITAKKRSKEE